MSSEGFVVFDYKILQKEFTALLFSILNLPVAGVACELDPLCKDNEVSQAAPVSQKHLGLSFLPSLMTAFLDFSIQRKHSPYLTLRREYDPSAFPCCTLSRAPWSWSPSTEIFPFGESSATVKQQERGVKGVWAQKATDLVHALSRASLSISCRLNVKKVMVDLRVGEPDRGS